MASDAEPSTNSEISLQDRIVKDLRLLAAAFRDEAGRLVRGQRDANAELMEVAGWTIYAAWEKGLLDSVVDLNEILQPKSLAALKLGYPKRLNTEAPHPGPLIVPNAQRTLEAYLQELYAKWPTLKVEGKEDLPESSFPPLPPVDIVYSDNVALGLVGEVWQYIGCKHRDELPDDLALAMLHNTYTGGFFLNSSEGYKKAAFICDFIAEKIARQTVGESEGWITVSDAEDLTGINKGVLSRACDQEKLKSNGEKGPARRIELKDLVRFSQKWRQNKNDDDAVIGDYELQCTDCYVSYHGGSRCPKCHGATLKLVKVLPRPT